MVVSGHSLHNPGKPISCQMCISGPQTFTAAHVSGLLSGGVIVVASAK